MNMNMNMNVRAEMFGLTSEFHLYLLVSAAEVKCDWTEKLARLLFSPSLCKSVFPCVSWSPLPVVLFFYYFFFYYLFVLLGLLYSY